VKNINLNLTHTWRYIVWAIVILTNLLLRGISRRSPLTEYTNSQLIRAQWKYSESLLPTEDIYKDGYAVLAQIAGGNFDLRESLAHQVVASDLPYIDRLTRASFLYDIEQMDKALDILAKTPTDDLNQLSLSLAIRAHIYCMQKQYEECYLLAQESKNIDPVSSAAHLVSGYSSRVLKLYTESDEDFDISTALWGYIWWAYQLQRGITAYYARDLDLATSDLSLYLDDPVQWFDAHIFLGRAAYDQLHYTKAIELFQKALEIKEYNNWIPYMRLAKVYLRLDNMEQATIFYEYARLLSPTNTELLTDMMTMHHKQWDQTKVDAYKQEIIDTIQPTSGSYEVFGRQLRTIWDHALSQEYLTRGFEYLADIENEFIRERSENSLVYQQNLSTMKQIHLDLIRNEVDESQHTQKLNKLIGDGFNKNHITMYQARKKFINEDYNGSLQEMKLIDQEFGDIDMLALRYWWAIDEKDLDKAWYILSLWPQWDPLWDEAQTQLRTSQYIRMQSMLSLYRWNKEEALAALEQLRLSADRIAPEQWEPETLYRLQQQAHQQFTPRIYSITPYIDTL